MKKLYFTVDELADRWKCSKDDVYYLGAEGELLFGVYLDHVWVKYSWSGKRLVDGEPSPMRFATSGYIPVTSSSIAAYLVGRPPVEISVDGGRMHAALLAAGFSVSKALLSSVFDHSVHVELEDPFYVETETTSTGEGISLKPLARLEDVIEYERRHKGTQAQGDGDDRKVLRVLGALLDHLVNEKNLKQSGLTGSLIHRANKTGLGKTVIDTVFSAANKEYKNTPD
jgi:hypothetical protein